MNVHDEWVPVSERLPEVFRDVLVARRVDGADEPYLSVAYLEFDGRWVLSDGDEVIEPTAWRLLPEPPKEV